MAVVAGGVNFCSIVRDFGIPAGLLPFTGIFETILEGDSFSIFYLFLREGKRVERKFQFFRILCFRSRRFEYKM